MNSRIPLNSSGSPVSLAKANILHWSHMRMTDMKGTGNGNGSSSITIFSSPAISNSVVTMHARLGITWKPWKGERASETGTWEKR